ncbi:hypothetical protein Q8G35_22940 [Peribacillus simplex]|uniref:Uncharacterized protein n=2 Tax=Peribacillus TaxID=2675229 RepID=A0AA90P5R8_9BACI|nr:MULTISPECIES: hypothetical protein [Peribacillus]MDP1421155.1 hypothetical protein [Peribacillus simplex]MDP1453922.1 hypothetical protein [Peribacillus frigoritolerans]
MKQCLKEVFINIKNQLILANETVEYTSWLTASIFSVLGVFTIFLSHQYQNHTSELKKLIWKMRNNVKREDPSEFEQNVVDFEYFSKTPKVLMKAIQTSIIVLWILVPIWFISGLSTFFTILNKKGTTHYLSLFLTIIVTGLFIFFSIRLAIILNNLSDTEEEGTKILNIKELFNAKHLVEKNFDIPKLLKMNNTTWHFLLSGSEPYSKVKIESEYGVYNYSSLLYIEATGYEVYISTPIALQENGTLPKELNLTLTDQQRINIQRFFYEVHVNQMTVSQVILVEGTYYCFKGQISREGDLITVNVMEPRNNIDLPTEIEQDFKSNVQIVDVIKMF